MKQNLRILTVTVNPSIDKNSTIERVVAERKLRCGPPSYEPGGGGLNVSRAIRKLGGRSTAFFVTGGPTGRMLELFIRRERIPHRLLRTEEWTRENLTIFEKQSGRQFRFGMPGPKLAASDWKQCMKRLAQLRPVPDVIVLSGSLPGGVPADFYGRCARLFRKKGVRLIVDASGEALNGAVGQGAYLIKSNLRELRDLTGRKLGNANEIRLSITRLIRKNAAEVIVVSLGANGAILADSKTYECIRAPRVSVKSAIGAGDSMVAGIALAMARGKDLRTAVRFGVASGTAAVMTPGTELCRRKDAEKIFRLIKQRSSSNGKGTP